MDSSLITVLLVIAFANIVVGQEETQCRGVDLNMNATQKAEITDCLREAGIKSVYKMPAAKLACFGVCILQKKGMLTDDGKLNHDKIIKYVELVLKPDEVKKPIVDGIEKCMKEHGDRVKGKDGEDPTCMTFMDVGLCVHEVFLDICLE